MLERSKPLSARDALTIARIVRVNHAGEYGAIRIYGAQIAVSARWYPDVVPALADMLRHEKRHCAAFFAAMPARLKVIGASRIVAALTVRLAALAASSFGSRSQNLRNTNRIVPLARGTLV